jgi:hypothetical protein
VNDGKLSSSGRFVGVISDCTLSVGLIISGPIFIGGFRATKDGDDAGR